jgi:hypothetical protein
MKRIFLIILILPVTLFSQNEYFENASIFATNQILNTTIINKKLVANSSNQFVDRGLFTMKGTLAVGFPSAYTGTNMYVSGNMEYYLEKMISFRGGLYLFLGTSGADDVFKQNSTLFTGFYFHPKTNNHLDPYIGLEPGISWTQLNPPTTDETTVLNPTQISNYPNAASPIISGTIGINYFASNFTHLFIEAKYIAGTHQSDVESVSLNEFRIAFGFGFNLWAIKR